MANLTAEQLNADFLKHFMPETLFLLEQDSVPVVGAPAPQEVTALIPDSAPISQPETPVLTSSPSASAIPAGQTHAASTPAIPKLPKVEKTKEPKPFEAIGENRKGVIVLVTLPAADFQALPQSDFLRKILAAIGFGPADVAFVNNVSGGIARFEMLREAMSTNYIISFASRLDTDFPHEKFTLYNPVLVDGVPVVFSQSLAVLDGDQEQKKLLWGALQRVFK